MNEKVEELYKEFVESYTGNPADVIFTKINKEQGALIFRYFFLQLLVSK